MSHASHSVPRPEGVRKVALDLARGSRPGLTATRFFDNIPIYWQCSTDRYCSSWKNLSQVIQSTSRLEMPSSIGWMPGRGNLVSVQHHHCRVELRHRRAAGGQAQAELGRRARRGAHAVRGEDSSPSTPSRTGGDGSLGGGVSGRRHGIGDSVSRRKNGGRLAYAIKTHGLENFDLTAYSLNVYNFGGRRRCPKLP